MDTRTKAQKAKDWMLKNGPDLIGVGLAVSFVSGVTYLVYRGAKANQAEHTKMVEAYNEYADEMNTWLAEEQADGNSIYVLHDGAFLVVPDSANPQYVLK